MSKSSVELRILVWDDDSGERIEIREDGDGLELAVIAQVDTDGKTVSTVTFSDAQFEKFCGAVQAYSRLKKELVEK